MADLKSDHVANVGDTVEFTPRTEDRIFGRGVVLSRGPDVCGDLTYIVLDEDHQVYGVPHAEVTTIERESPT